MSMAPRTSESHPLQVATLATGRGAIGITFCPGKHQHLASSGNWARSLASDLDTLARWSVSEIITLVESHELDALRVPHLGAAIVSRGWRWHHWPIIDGKPPDQRFVSAWARESDALAARIRHGARVVVHCKGGLGRAGTVATLIWSAVTGNTDVDHGIALVRQARPGAIETSAQEEFLRTAIRPPRAQS